MLLSLVAWYISYTSGLVTIYNDAMSHLNISRMVIDNLEPGFAQLGGVWLPLTHILPLPLIWNDWAWHSGFAGSFFSMAAYVISVGAIYKTIFLLTKKSLAAIVGSLVFACNLNMLYLQTTPMTEPIYIGIFSLSMFFFTLYLTKKRNTKYLLILGMLGFLQVLTRYDGWFVVVFQAMLIAVNELFVMRKSIAESVGRVFLFAIPVSFGIGLWLLWNALIFGNPLFFAYGEYSAHSQQLIFENRGELATRGDIITSIITYGQSLLHNIGVFVALLAVVSIVIFLRMKKVVLPISKRVVFLAFLFSPILFNILALFLGFSVILTPPFSFGQNLLSLEPWFNIRYGLLALPLVAISIGFFASWKKLALAVAFLVIMVQAYYTYTYGIASLVDGTIGSSSYYAVDMTEAVKTRVKPEDKVLMSLYSFNQVAFKSGIDLNQVVHEGVSRQWSQAQKNPENYADWVVMINEVSDPLYSSLVVNNKETFLKSYKLVYTGNNSSIYQRKNN